MNGWKEVGWINELMHFEPVVKFKNLTGRRNDKRRKGRLDEGKG